jgi:hypothetical protein
MGKTYEVYIPDFHCALANHLVGKNHFAVARLKKRDREIIGNALTKAGVPQVAINQELFKSVKKADGLLLAQDLAAKFKARKRRVNYLWHMAAIQRDEKGRMLKGARRDNQPDPDGPLKSMLDALVHNGFLVNDTELWVTFDADDFQFIRNKDASYGMTIQLTDLS